MAAAPIRRCVRQFRLAPAAAERHDKADSVGLDLPLSGQLGLLRCQLLLLRGDDGGEGLGARLILIERDLRRLARDAHVLRLDLRLARQDANPCKVVLNLLDRRQHCLAIDRHIGLVGLLAASTCAPVRPPLNSGWASEAPNDQIGLEGPNSAANGFPE